MEHSKMDLSSPISKAVNYVLLSVSYLGTVWGLEIDWKFVVLMLCSSLAGSITLQYLQREKVRAERLFKGLVSTVAGAIFGVAYIDYTNVEKASYQALVFFLASVFSLTLVRTLVSNAKTICVAIVSKWTPQMTGEGEERRPRRRSLPRVTPDRTEPPGAPVALEQTIEVKVTKEGE